MSELWMPLIVAYLIGSLPFAFIVSKVSHGVDPRTLGDHNLGARNVYKSVGHAEGLMVGILDIGKGYMTIQLGQSLGIDIYGQFALGFFSIVGHNWSIFLKFHGGQGMATTVGVLLGLTPLPTLFSILIWAITYLFTRNWDLSCGIGLVLIPITSWFWVQNLPLSMYATGLLPMIWISKLLQNITIAHKSHYIDNGHP